MLVGIKLSDFWFMISPTTYKRWVWLVHVLFWCLYLTLSGLIFNRIFERPDQALMTSTVNLVGMLILVYTNLEVLVPSYFLKKKYWEFGIWLLVLLIATTLFRFWTTVLMIQWMDWEEMFKHLGINLYVGIVFGGIFVLMLSIPLYLIDNWLRRTELETELDTQQLKAELRFLKAQVNPHFLFNALNNIYSLSFTQSDKAPEMILKLSDMMSYMLYECKDEQVRLSSEIGYLKNFIDLQQLKKDGEQQIAFDVAGPLEGVLIPPMLLIPFFENAFKHGNVDDTQTGYLRSKLEVLDQELRFDIHNSIDPSRTKPPAGGVGLSNVKDRLKLLFPDRHVLTIDAAPTSYSLHLEIDLS